MNLLVAGSVLLSAALAAPPLQRAPTAPTIQPNFGLTAATAEQLRAREIASKSPSASEAARRLKAQAIGASAAFGALRQAFTGANAERSNYQALRAAGYTAVDVAQALKTADRLDARGLAGRLRPIVPVLETGSVGRQLYGLDMDPLFQALCAGTACDDAFAAALAAMDYAPQQAAQTGFRYYQGRFARSRDGSPFPDASWLYVNAMAGASHFEKWQLLLQAGYAPGELYGELPFGSVNPGSGRATDEVARCIERHFTLHLRELNPTLVLSLLPDGSMQHNAEQRGCYAQFSAQLRAQGVAENAARQILFRGIDCRPNGNPGCAAEMESLLDTIMA
ncbi:MAG: hypothetical protein ACLGI7_07870, partial [Gammaproteobacteria bacterium]